MAFGKVGELYKLQKEARSMQKKMKSISIDGESKDGSVVVMVNGLQEIVDIDIDEELLSPQKKKDLVKNLKQALKVANKKLQKEMMKDMDVNQLRGMLGM